MAAELVDIDRTYAQLEPRHRAIVDAKRVDDRMPAREWFDLLDPLARFDQAVDVIKPTGCGLPIWAAAILFLLTPLTFGISVFILIFVAWKHHQTVEKRVTALDLYNGLREVVHPLVEILGEDVRASEPIHLKLDLTSPIDPGKTFKPPVPVEEPRYTSSTFFENPWLELDTELANGARLTVRVTDEVRRTSRQKQNPRGKWKTKVKFRARHRVAVKLVLPAKDKASRVAIKSERLTVTRGVLAVPVVPLRHVLGAIGEAFSKAAGASAPA